MSAVSPRTKRIAVTTAKAAVGVLLLAVLAWQAQREEHFRELVREPKRWDMLALAVLSVSVTVVLSFFRWRLVARAADVPLSVGEAVRLGALGYTLNFVSPGSVGGDVFKAAVLAKDRAGRRTAAVTTVVVDRVLALVSFLLFAAVGFVALRATDVALPAEVLTAGWAAVALSAAVPVGLLLLMTPGVTGPTAVDRVAQVPVMGNLLAEVLICWGQYRNGLVSLAAALGVCLVGHVFLVTSFYLVAAGLPLAAPTWLEHAFIVPFGCLAGSIPISPHGLGTVELTFSFFYDWFGHDGSTGGLVAFGQRLAMLALAGVAVPYYLTHQAVVKRALGERGAADAA